jgi:hypothetical protein
MTTQHPVATLPSEVLREPRTGSSTNLCGRNFLTSNIRPISRQDRQTTGEN